MALPTEIKGQEGFDVPMTAGSVGKKKAYSSIISWQPPTMVKCAPQRALTHVVAFKPS